MDMSLLMIAYLVGMRTDDRQLVSHGGQPGEASPEGDAWELRLHLTVDAAIFHRSVHLGIKGLDLARPTGEVEQNNGLVPHIALIERAPLRREQAWERQPAKPQASDPKEITPAETGAISASSRLDKIEHCFVFSSTVGNANV